MSVYNEIRLNNRYNELSYKYLNLFKSYTVSRYVYAPNTPPTRPHAVTNHNYMIVAVIIIDVA